MRVAVDIVLFGYVEGDLKLLLIRRKYAPFENQWAFPGGFVLEDESIDDAVARELEEETGVTNAFTEQLYTFGAPKRDPRERIISVTYYGLIRPELVTLRADTDTTDARWFSCKALPALAFDHQAIYDVALTRLQGKLSYQPIGFELLPERFILSDLRELYETLLGKELDKSNFRRKIMSLDILDELDEKREMKMSRPATLYSFNKEKYDKRVSSGFYFEL